MKEEAWDKLIKDALEQEVAEHPIYEGHELRFDQKLKNRDRLSRVIRLRTLTSIAALVVMGIGLWLYNSEEVIAKSDSNPIETPPQVEYAKEFFQQNSSINIHSLDYQDEKVTRFLQELTQLENEYQMLDSLYRNNVSNESLIKGMVENFQYRLLVVQKIKAYIELKKSIQSNENI